MVPDELRLAAIGDIVVPALEGRAQGSDQIAGLAAATLFDLGYKNTAVQLIGDQISMGSAHGLSSLYDMDRDGRLVRIYPDELIDVMRDALALEVVSFRLSAAEYFAERDTAAALGAVTWVLENTLEFGEIVRALDVAARIGSPSALELLENALLNSDVRISDYARELIERRSR